MDKRSDKRVIVAFNAELVSNNLNYAGIIENLSDKGVFMRTFPVKTPLNFPPGSKINLKFRLPSGEKLSLNCIVRWFFKTPPHGLTNSIGMEIKNPPARYKEFLSNPVYFIKK